MAMSQAHGSGGGGKRRRGRKSAPMADLNMIPFIDVMLVLLVIFIVAAPLMTTGVPVDLPKTGASQLNVDQKPIAVTVDERGRIFVQEREITLENLASAIAPLARQGFDERIFVRGAAEVNYGRVAEVLAALTRAGYTKTALVNQPASR
jgi:biopolymer transport protein TolR